MDANGEPWKKLQLSLERPYKDEHGVPIPTLYDINPDGVQFFERKETGADVLSKNLSRIFTERGLDFFDKTQNGNFLDIIASTKVEAKDKQDEMQPETTGMTSEEMRQMIYKIGESLVVAQGELSEAAALLDAILPSSAPTYNPAAPQLRQLMAPRALPDSTPTLLTATFVKKPPPILSVETFNAQLAIGDKDEALRKAADVFRSSAAKMEGSRVTSEKYWADALKIRKGNWGLVPAPLPPGAATGKGADKSSKDFMVTYGLEESSQVFRRRAIAWMAEAADTTEDIVFPHRQNTRLRVCLVKTDDGKTHITYSSTRPETSTTLENMLQKAQQEMVEQEIFSYLVSEASSLPTAAAQVSERVIAIDAALGTELRLELVEGDAPLHAESYGHQPICDLIYHSLHTLLLRRHAYLKKQRLEGPLLTKMDSPLILQPVIDILQYEVFSKRVQSEINAMVSALIQIGIQCVVRFQPVGQVGDELVKLLDNRFVTAVGGQCVLRIDHRHSIRFSFTSPSTLTAHLPQATLTISSIPQLAQLLRDDVSRFLLERICELGREIAHDVGAIWFLDLDRCIGKWEGCVFNFRMEFDPDNQSHIKCTAFCLDHTTPKGGQIDTYHKNSMALLEWVNQKITGALRPTAA